MYIGNTPNNQAYTPAVDFFSGNASTTAFTLSRPVASTYQMLVVVANVTQNPGSAYTVSGNTITFASAPPSGTNNIWVQYTSLLVQVIVPTNSYQVTGPVYTGVSAPLGGATNPITGSTGSANNYIQTYIYNTFNGANSSADFTAYASNGTDASGWADMGITGPSFSQAAYSVTGPGEPYLFGSAPSGAGASGNLVIATDSTGSSNAIQFYTGGFNQAKSAARMTIAGTGAIGFNGATYGSSGQVLTSAGSGASPTWSTPSSGLPGVLGQAFTSSGTFTIPANVTALKITVVGGGGNGGSGASTAYASGGGGGGTAISYLTGLTPGNTLAVTVGGAGGNSTVASGTQTISTITGGGGGSGGGGIGTAGSGGSGSGGTINIGASGGVSGEAGCSFMSGAGGSSTLGGGGAGITGGSAVGGSAGRNYGGGGGGGIYAGGGSGAQGIVIFEW